MKCKYIDSSLLMISEKGLEQMQLYPENTLLLVTRSGILRHTIPVAILKKPATINQDLKAIMLYSPNLEEYIYICIKGMESRLILEYTKAGATVENINFDAFQKILLPIPPENQIQRIIDATNDTDEVIGKLKIDQENLIDIIDKTKSKILDLAIRGKLVPQNPDDEPASVLLERIRAEKEELIRQGKIKRDKKESVIFKGEDNSYYEKIGDSIVEITDEIPFELPSNCLFVRFKDVWELLSGRDLAPDDYNDQGEGIPYITGASNFFNETVAISRWTNSPQVVTKLGDLLITCKGTVGETAFNTFGDAHIARQIMAMRNNYHLNIEYLSLCIKYYIESLKTAAKGLIPGISRGDILNLILPMPSETYQTSVVNRVNELFEIIEHIKKSLS